MSAPGLVADRAPAAGGTPAILTAPGREGPQGRLLLVLLCGGYATGALFRWGSEELAMIMGDFGLSAAALAAAISCFHYARTHGSPFRPAWMLFALSSAMAACGNAVWGWYEVVLDRPVPDPSLADLFFLLFAPPVIIGLLVLAKRPANRARWVCLVLDSWLIAGSLLTLSWSLALARTARFDNESVARAALSLAYPLLDIVLVSMLLALHFRRSKGSHAAVHTAVAALALTVLCDALFTSPLLRDTYRSGQFLDAGWFTGSLLLAYAPWMTRRAAAAPPPRAGSVLPAAPSPVRSPRSRRTSRPGSAPSASCTSSSKAAAWTASSSSPAARSSSRWSSGRASCCSTTSRSPRNWPRRRTTSGPWSRVPATSS